MFTNPKKNIESFEILPGFTIADLGAGPGSYTILAAKLVGDLGRVYAIDILKELLSTIKKEATKEHLSNVEVVWGDVEKSGGTRLADSSIDVVIASNILFQVENKEAFVSEIKRILKPSGKVCVIDWTDSFAGLGPESDSVVDASLCKEIFSKSGFKVHREITDAGEHHYGIIFKNQL